MSPVSERERERERGERLSSDALDAGSEAGFLFGCFDSGHRFCLGNRRPMSHGLTCIHARTSQCSGHGSKRHESGHQRAVVE